MAHVQDAARQFDFSASPALASLPPHLRQFAVEQMYDQYTPVDHAVWRFIMRQNIFFLKEFAHRLYFKGLLNTGISFERIPRIEEMNEILTKIGWGAVAVDGFIPPAAFMEFQAYKVLVIAADMRQIHHVEYTPAPDIVHEAAGHAPIIVDEEYADYLQHFGEIGAKAMSSKKDVELYEAIRHLSILKERPRANREEIGEAEKTVEQRQQNLGKPSEMALLSRLHWWTVEYGLIGDLEQPKIYGAGLLSSIGEAASCLKPDVKKIPYTVDAVNYAFDITTKQPQLFVTPDFTHLNRVLEEFADTMAFRRGGLVGINKAIECQSVATCEYSSGLQVSGVFTEVITDDKGSVVYLKATGPCALSYQDRQLEGHGTDYHGEGFSSPVGKFKNCPRPPESLDDSALKELGVEVGKQGALGFESGVIVSGRLEKVERRQGKIILLVFSDCRVTFNGTVLFQPEWGTYDMAVGEHIASVFNGAADKTAYQDVTLIPKERTIKVNYDEKDRRLQALYEEVRKIRETESGYDRLESIWRHQQKEHPQDWLLSMEIYEILDYNDLHPDLRNEIKAYLNRHAEEVEDHATVIEWGFRLVDYHRESA
jgi:phenylalanine-4-hydroxylase